jgi:hypothetical protein
MAKTKAYGFRLETDPAIDEKQARAYVTLSRFLEAGLTVGDVVTMALLTMEGIETDTGRLTGTADSLEESVSELKRIIEQMRAGGLVVSSGPAPAQTPQSEIDEGTIQNIAARLGRGKGRGKS